MVLAFVMGAALLQEPATDPLDKPVTIRADVARIAFVTEELSKQIGIPIEVAPKLRDELVILYAKERPGREVLMRLASHFGWEWEKTAGGYRLVQSPSSEFEEKRLLEESILKRMKSCQEQVKKELAKIANTNKEEIEKKLEEIQKKIEEIQSQALQGEESPEQYRNRWASLHPLYEERRELEGRINPYRRLVCSLFVSLSSQQLLELEKRGRLVFSTRPTNTQYAFPASLQSEISGFIVGIIEMQKKVAERWEYIERQKTQAKEEDDVVQMPSVWGVKVFGLKDVSAVRIVLRSPSLRNGNGMDAKVSVLGTKGELLMEESCFVPDIGRNDNQVEEPTTKVFDTEPRNKSEETQNGKENRNPLRDELDKRLDSDRFEKAWVHSKRLDIFPIRTIDIANLFKPGSSVDPLSPFGIMLNEAASQSGVALIGDAYDVYSEAPLPAGNDVLTARKLFDAYGKSTNCEWKFEDGWVTIRNREWAFARAHSVPRDVLFTVRDTCFKQCGLNFEQTAWLASSLNERQASSPLMILIAGPAWEMIERYEDLSFLRMWANLSPVQKGNLRAGGMLSFSDLNPIAKNCLWDYLYRKESLVNERAYHPFVDFGFFDEKIVADLRADVSVDMQTTDTEVTQLLPNGIPPGSEIHLDIKRRESLATILKIEELGGVEFPFVLPTKVFAEIEEWASSGMSVDDFFTVEKDRLKPATAEMWRFELILFPGTKTETSFISTYSDPSYAFGTFESLPLELQKRVAQLREEIRQKRKDDGDGGKEAR